MSLVAQETQTRPGWAPRWSTAMFPGVVLQVVVSICTEPASIAR